jgi:pyridinium-3,5-bisthiocarboxylic acid mononucleotide nickel chelatase
VTEIAYIDCVAGVAGDMLLGALLDAGADAEAVRRGIAGLPLEGLELSVERAERGGIAAARIAITAPPEQPLRTWADVRELIDAAALPERARRRAQAAFRRLAEAEARVHSVEPDEVRFHEVGAADAIADVCGVVLALEGLGIDALCCSPLPAPRGLVEAAHGRLPLPAPAVLELLRGAPLYGVDLDSELVTPTGAALVAALAEGYGPIPPLRLRRIGYGAGARRLGELPNVVRVLVGERLEGGPGAEVRVVETNLDDLPPELVPDASARCFAAGALDVWVTPVQMKKGRPGLVLSALVRPAQERAVAEAVLRETTALGVRVSSVRRLELTREWRTVEVFGEEVRVKVGSLDGERLNLAPEHDDCATAAARARRPVKDVWAAALAAAERGEAR